MAFRIGIIGAGNVGSHLCKAFSKNHKVVVYTRRGATHLLKEVSGLVWTEHLSSFRRGFDFIIIAVNDDGISEVARKLKPEEGIVLHTSGSTDISILKENKLKNYGVFYPLQSFRKKQKLKYKEIPVFIEANSKENLKKLSKLAKSFSEYVIEMDSSQRKRLHLGAVVVNNFSNHLYKLSQDFLNHHKISFVHLLPLIQETGRRLDNNKPSEMQTGPAKRRDGKIMKEHIDMLENDKDLKEIYDLISTSIGNSYKKS